MVGVLEVCLSSMLLAYITSKNSFLPRVYFKFFSVVQFHPHINLRKNILLFVFVFLPRDAMLARY